MMITRRECLGTLAGCAALPLAASAAPPAGLLIDSHVHLFDPNRFPYAPQATYKPPPQPLEPYIEFARQAGISHTIIVHPEPYQDDHRYLEYCFQHEPSPGFFKGSCLFDPVAPDTPRHMEALVNKLPGRIVALRIHENHKPGTPPTTSGAIRDRDMAAPAMRETWRKAHALGLAIQMHFIPHYAPQIGALAEQFPRMPVILDHLARAGQGTPAEYDNVLKLASLPRVYMKFSGVEYSSKAGYPYRDVQPLVRRTFDAFGPDRLIWGGLGMNMPAFEKNQAMFEEMFAFASAADRAKIRGQNAALLFQFPPMNEIKLVTVDPGHFHAALIQKEMYPGVSKRSTVYAPLGPDVIDHLQRVARFNSRPDNPTAWEIDVHTSPDFLERMIADKPGNVVVLSGRNRRKIELIQASVNAGLNVLADKPWIIHKADLPKVEATLAEAARRGLVAYDIMTERYEITSILQRELVRDAAIFGDPVSVDMESVHHIMKLVAGIPNLRPPWFFDVEEQGEALADVGTHLVDLAQWTLFPDQSIDYRRQIHIENSRRWPVKITPAQFRQVTGQGRETDLDYHCNNSIAYKLRGVPVKMDVLWHYEAPEGTGDTYLAIFKGTQASIEIRQGKPENYRPELYVKPGSPKVAKKVEAWQSQWPGVGVREQGGEMQITIPDKYRVGHEAHFAQVTRQFFAYLNNPAKMPPWEEPGMLAKYFVSTAG